MRRQWLKDDDWFDLDESIIWSVPEGRRAGWADSFVLTKTGVWAIGKAGSFGWEKTTSLDAGIKLNALGSLGGDGYPILPEGSKEVSAQQRLALWRVQQELAQREV